MALVNVIHGLLRPGILRIAWIGIGAPRTRNRTENQGPGTKDQEPSMMFILRMALRETRASWKRLLFFFLCLAIGVGGIVTLRSVIESVRRALMSDARAITSADVVISSDRPWDRETLGELERRLQQAPVLQRTDSVETTTMVRPADESKATTRLVELEGVQAGFPLYGEVELAGGARYSHALFQDRGALVRPELLAQLGIGRGERIVIGGQPFTIRGVILSEPGRRAGAFSFGPRVLVDYGALVGTGLLGFGSRARYQIRLCVREDGIQPLVDLVRRDFRNRFVRVRSYRGTEDDIGEDLARAEDYLSLVGLVIVLLGGIGVATVTRAFVQQKIRSVAVLKCVGATTIRVLSIYLLQVALLGIAGAVVGVGLAYLTIRSLAGALGTDVLAGVQYGLTASAVLQGLVIGLLVSLLFSLVPLLEIRHVKPSWLLRETIAPQSRRDWMGVVALAGVVGALIALVSWQAGSVKIGLAVSVGFASVALVLQLAGAGLLRVIAPLGRARSVAVRHAVLRLTRRASQGRAVLLAVGLGSFFIVGVRALQMNLLANFSVELDRTGADMFLIDVQRDQIDGVRRIVESTAGGSPVAARFIPVLRARVTGVEGRAVNLESYQEVRGRGELGREFVITYRAGLEPNERVVRGRWWPAEAAPSPEVSIEKSLSDRFKIDVGDLLRFDMAGRTMTARVTSVRTVDWRDARNGGFMFVFRPGPLDNAPFSFIVPLKAPADPARRARLQRDLVERYSNVTAIDVVEILETVRKVLDKVTLAITVVGTLVLGSGVLILIGSVSMTKFQRIYEAAIFKTVGASTRLVATMLLLEYGMLGLLAGIIGSTGAIALSWWVSRHALNIRWSPMPALTLGGTVATAVLVAAIGLGASVDVLRRRPLATLRAE